MRRLLQIERHICGNYHYYRGDKKQLKMGRRKFAEFPPPLLFTLSCPLRHLIDVLPLCFPTARALAPIILEISSTLRGFGNVRIAHPYSPIRRCRSHSGRFPTLRADLPSCPFVHAVKATTAPPVAATISERSAAANFLIFIVHLRIFPFIIS